MVVNTLEEWNKKTVDLAERMQKKEQQIQYHVQRTRDTELQSASVLPLINEKYKMTVEAGVLEQEFKEIMAARQ